MPRHSDLRETGRDGPVGFRFDQKGGDERFEGKETTLTAMENRVLTLVTLAKTNKEIAHALRISPATVKRHVENLLKKLDLRNRVEAAIYGLSMGECCSANNGGCPLIAWRKWHANGKYGPIGQ